MEIAKDEFQDKPHKGLRWRCYWWMEEYRTRVINRKAHLARSIVQTKSYEKEREDIRAQLKKYNQMFYKLLAIDFEKELGEEDLALLKRSPKPIKLVNWHARKIERETELPIEKIDLKYPAQKQNVKRFGMEDGEEYDFGDTGGSVFNGIAYWFEMTRLAYPSPEWQYEKKCGLVDDEDLEDKEYKKYQQKLKQRREKYQEEKMNREKGKRQGKEAKGIIQINEVSNLKRVLGQLQAVLKMVDSQDCRCRNITYQLKSISSITLKIAFHILERHIKVCIDEKDYKELELSCKAMDKLSKECAMLGILKDKEEEILWENLERAKYRVNKPIDVQ